MAAGYHTYRLEFDGINKYTLYVDNVLRAGPTTSTRKVNNFMMGNPLFAFWCACEWADFQIDYLRVTIPGYRAPRRRRPSTLRWCPPTSSARRSPTLPTERTPLPPAYPSCSPPQQTSDYLTVGTSDANGQLAKSAGYVRATVVPDNTGTPADEADVTLQVSLTDVREQAGLGDYNCGELEARPTVRITDQLDGGGPLPQTTVDFPFPISVPCATTADTTIGSTCGVLTSANSLMPGAAAGGKRAIWALPSVDVYDGGSDGDAATTADDTLFATQGVFVP